MIFINFYFYDMTHATSSHCGNSHDEVPGANTRHHASRFSRKSSGLHEKQVLDMWPVWRHPPNFNGCSILPLSHGPSEWTQRSTSLSLSEPIKQESTVKIAHEETTRRDVYSIKSVQRYFREKDG